MDRVERMYTFAAMLESLLTEGDEGAAYEVFDEETMVDLMAFIRTDYRPEDVGSAFYRAAREFVANEWGIEQPEESPRELPPDADLLDHFIVYIETVIGDYDDAELWVRCRKQYWGDQLDMLRVQVQQRAASKYFERLPQIVDLAGRQQRGLERAMRDYERLRAMSPAREV